MNRSKNLLKALLPPRFYRAPREAMQREILHWIEGHAAFAAPGPPLLMADQPTYAPMRVYAAAGDPPARVGRYCSINETVTLMTGSEHHMDSVSSYFFERTSMNGGRGGYSRGPITIGCDVWIGRDALLLSGVNIGHGAVIASRAVVSRDVAPFEVVGGVPARHIRWRFDEATRGKLLKIAWWDWPVEAVFAHGPQLNGRGEAVESFVSLHSGAVSEQCEACHSEHRTQQGAALRGSLLVGSRLQEYELGGKK